MIALLKDGQVLHRGFIGMTTGYRAQTVILERGDVDTMLKLLSMDPNTLKAHLIQLNERWEK